MPTNQFSQFRSPIQGCLTPLDQVPDPVFAGKIMGEGFAIEPQTGGVIAPFNATVTSLMEDSRHAVGLTAEDGTEVLIHFGIDTVKLGGVGFTALVNQGDTVQAGQLLLQVDLAMIQNKVPSIVSPIVFTNLQEGLTVKVEAGRFVQAGEKGFFCVEKTNAGGSYP
jgi:PTS system D-glucosamine-specific IIC component